MLIHECYNYNVCTIDIYTIRRSGPDAGNSHTHARSELSTAIGGPTSDPVVDAAVARPGLCMPGAHVLGSPPSTAVQMRRVSTSAGKFVN